MYRFLLVIVSLLTACAAGSGGRPEVVLVERDRITVSMSNGWPCTGFRTAENETEDGWAGTLEGCPAAYPYRVTLRGARNPVRIVLEEVLSTVGAEGLLRPVASVEIIGQGGVRYTFQSPDRLPEDD